MDLLVVVLIVEIVVAAAAFNLCYIDNQSNMSPAENGNNSCAALSKMLLQEASQTTADVNVLIYITGKLETKVRDG